MDPRKTQKMERQLSCRLTIVNIENASETLSVLNWINH